MQALNALFSSSATGSINLPQATLAVGALGTAAFGLVDATKALLGGISNVGFGQIKAIMTKLLPAPTPSAPAADASDATVTPESSPGLPWSDIKSILYANWINGMAAPDQKAVAKAFIKLHFNASTAGALAALTGVDAATLKSVAQKVPAAAPLSLVESDVQGRFDLALSALIDKAYQRADQLYRNWSRFIAGVFAVALCFIGNWSVAPASRLPGWECLLIGVIATPLAPIAKDAASALQAASDAMQAVRR